MGCSESATLDRDCSAQPQQIEPTIQVVHSEESSKTAGIKKLMVENENLDISEAKESSENAINVEDTVPGESDEMQISRHPRKSVQILLCGPGESGKTTFLRQILKNYSSDALKLNSEESSHIIRGNIIETMQTILRQALRDETYILDENESHAKEILDVLAYDCIFTKALSNSVASLWSDSAIQEVFCKKYELPVMDNITYYVDKLAEIADESYTPSYEDIIHSISRTSGEKVYEVRKNSFKVYLSDTGGQQSSRNNWIGSIPRFDLILYMVSVGDLDRPLFEDTNTTRFQDSIDLFSKIVSKTDPNVPILLLLNKVDILEERASNSSYFREMFPEFQGNPCSVESCIEFLVHIFQTIYNENRSGQILGYICLSALSDSNSSSSFSEILKMFPD